MRPKQFTQEVEERMRFEYASLPEEDRAAISEEQFFARAWLSRYCKGVGMKAHHHAGFLTVHGALCSQGGNCWDATKGLITLILKATAHKRG